MADDGPAQFDDQFNGEGPPSHWLWIEALQAHREIVDTEVVSPGVTRFILDDINGVEEGMLVGLRKGPDGTRMWELDHPEFARLPDGRRVVRTWREEFARGERNYLWPRSFFDFWLGNNAGRAYIGEWAETTSWQINPIGGVDVTGLPPDTLIPVGSWLHDIRSDGLGGVTTWHVVVANVTTDGSGNATLLIIEQPVVDGQTSSVTPGQKFLMYILPNEPPGAAFGPYPSLTPGVGELGRPFEWRHKPFHGPLHGQTVINQPVGQPSITVTNLPIPGPLLIERIQPGDIVDVNVEPSGFHVYLPVAGHTDVDGSGQAVIPVRGDGGGFGGNYPVTIIRPGGQDEPGDNAVVLPSIQRFSAEPYTPQTASGSAGYDGAMGGVRIATAFPVQHDAAVPSVWGHVGYTLVGGHGAARLKSNVGPSGADQNNFQPPALSIISALNPSEAAATALDVDRELAPGQTIDVVLRVQHQLLQDDKLTLAFNGPVFEPGSQVAWAGPSVIVRWMMLTLGSDPAVPPFSVASLANLLHQRGNQALKAMVIGERFIRLRIRDVAAEPGYVAEDEVPILGGDIRLPEIDNLVVRVVAIMPSLTDPADTEIIVDALPPKLLPILPPGVQR